MHLLYNLPQSFGKVAEMILRKICNYKGKTIHLVFDKFFSPSIKDIERDQRASATNQDVYATFFINGPEQKQPSNWQKALRNNSFKSSIIHFLTSYWERDEMAPYFNGKDLFVNDGDICYFFQSANDSVNRREFPALYSTHEEADSRMIFHAKSTQPGSNVVIRTIDTDVLVIVLGCLNEFDANTKIWIEIGIQSKNTLRYISVNQIHETLGLEFCQALLHCTHSLGVTIQQVFLEKEK